MMDGMCSGLQLSAPLLTLMLHDLRVLKARTCHIVIPEIDDPGLFHARPDLGQGSWTAKFFSGQSEKAAALWGFLLVHVRNPNVNDKAWMLYLTGCCRLEITHMQSSGWQSWPEASLHA